MTCACIPYPLLALIPNSWQDAERLRASRLAKAKQRLMRMQPGPHARGRCGATHGPRGDAGNALLDPKAPSPAEDLGEDAAFLLDERWDSDEDCQRAKRRPPGCDSCLCGVALPSQPLGV